MQIILTIPVQLITRRKSVFFFFSRIKFISQILSLVANVPEESFQNIIQLNWFKP